MTEKQQDILLPIELATSKLELEEIGALFVLMALPHFDNDHGWDKNKKLQEIIDNFFKRGILTQATDEDGLSVEIDLTKI